MSTLKDNGMHLHCCIFKILDKEIDQLWLYILYIFFGEREF